INDLIKQALSIPSFTLIIANYSPTKDPKSPIGELRKLNDKRIIILDEEDSNQSTFIGFIDNIMPDLYEEEENEVIANTLDRMYQEKSDLTKDEPVISEPEVISKPIEGNEETKSEEDDTDDLPF